MDGLVMWLIRMIA